jgi:hypothetical protein
VRSQKKRLTAVAAVLSVVTIFLLPGKQAFAQGIWATKTPMPTARGQAASGTINGITYVVGGEVANNCTPIHANEAYDANSDSWSTKAPMPTARWSFSVAVVNDILYAFGGGRRLRTHLQHG